MLDDFRQQANSTFEDEEPQRPSPAQPPQRYFLGMSPFQRFFVALMLLLVVCILSSFCLLVTDKIMLPFLN